MKKKIVVFGVALIMVLSSLALVGCGEDKHIGDFVGKWKSVDSDRTFYHIYSDRTLIVDIGGTYSKITLTWDKKSKCFRYDWTDGSYTLYMLNEEKDTLTMQRIYSQETKSEKYTYHKVADNPNEDLRDKVE